MNLGWAGFAAAAIALCGANLLAFAHEDGALGPSDRVPIASTLAPRVDDAQALQAPTVDTSRARPENDGMAFEMNPTSSRADRLLVIRSAVTVREHRAIAAMTKVAIDEDGYVAAALIQGLSDLATDAPLAERERATGALVQHLRDARAKAGTEGLAKGNVSLLIDALADTGSATAVTALIEALDSVALDLHQETRIVEALTALGDERGIPAIERFSIRIASISSGEPFAVELRSEALAAATIALARLRG